MALRIEDYALIGDLRTAALVGKNGSIDWLCLPRFDSPACFAALLGDDSNGRWLIAPKGEVKRVSRRYRGPTLVLETEMETEDGVVLLVDCMLPRPGEPELVRVVEGKKGRVPMRTEIVLRCDYGELVPWVRKEGERLTAVGGPDAFVFDSDVPLRGEHLTTVGEFTIEEGKCACFSMVWKPSYKPFPPPLEHRRVIHEAEAWWRKWADRCSYDGPWKDVVERSLVTLKGLIYAPTGGIVAAATTSLPEAIGGVRNWDYRYCWLRDATFSLLALLRAGYIDEAVQWRDWLLRAAAGDPSKLQIMYGPAGERRLVEYELDHLAGYERSRPVRAGNAARRQYQIDVYGEIVDAMYQACRAGSPASEEGWHLQEALMDFLETGWSEPDEGIWEVRGPRRHFTHSKVMAWVAADRMVRSVEEIGYQGPVDRWRALRDRIHREVCEKGYDANRRTFVQSYGSPYLDASLLMIPLVGFLPPEDPRVRGTVEAIEKRLVRDGFVYRYDAGGDVDGLPPGEGAFLMCTFWLADCLALLGRDEDARAMFERLIALRNDVGLLSEQYDPVRKRLVGNFPQAFSHVAAIHTAWVLSDSSLPRAPW